MSPELMAYIAIILSAFAAGFSTANLFEIWITWIIDRKEK